jgi:hypothetical protein
MDEKQTFYTRLQKTHEKYDILSNNSNPNNKNIKTNPFFTKQQTNIQQILLKHNITELLNDTVYVLPNTNILFIDYQLFKLFVIKELYPLVIQQFIQQLNELLKSYNTFEVHVNLKGLTVSSLQKYSGIFSLFYETCNKENIVFSKYITKCSLYNISNSIDAISKLIKQFVDDSVKKTVLFYNEKDSENMFSSLVITL